MSSCLAHPVNMTVTDGEGVASEIWWACAFHEGGPWREWQWENGDGPCPASREVGSQPEPVPNEYPAIWDLVIQDMHDRDEAGRKKYGVPLQPFNGRDALLDAYEEALDKAAHLRQVIYERNHGWGIADAPLFRNTQPDISNFSSIELPVWATEEGNEGGDLVGHQGEPDPEVPDTTGVQDRGVADVPAVTDAGGSSGVRRPGRPKGSLDSRPRQRRARK